jgi:hypothetical protein
VSVGFAIRAAKFVSEADFPLGAVGEKPTPQESYKIGKKRGSFEGAIRISCHALSFLFNDLAFLGIPRKPLKLLTLLFSIPTAPTKLLMFMTRRGFGIFRQSTYKY